MFSMQKQTVDLDRNSGWEQSTNVVKWQTSNTSNKKESIHLFPTLIFKKVH